MYATIRTYSGNTEIADQLAARSDEVESLLSGVSGFKGYYLVQADSGCVTVSLYDDKAGADESTRIAREWVQENASELTASTPEVSSGEVLFHAG